MPVENLMSRMTKFKSYTNLLQNNDSYQQNNNNNNKNKTS